MKTGIVILAAGEAQRMGEPKQLLAYRGTTLLGHAVATARALEGAPLVVALGAHAERIRAALNDAPVRVVLNEDWRTGMAGSVRTGLRALLAEEPDLEAAIFLVCDQPLVGPEVLEDLRAAHRAGARLAAASYGGALGVPALFSRSFFPELLALAGTAGARQVLHAHRDQVCAVPCPAAAFDIDTPADYARLPHAFPETLTSASV